MFLTPRQGRRARARPAARASAPDGKRGRGWGHPLCEPGPWRLGASPAQIRRCACWGGRPQSCQLPGKKANIENKFSVNFLRDRGPQGVHGAGSQLAFTSSTTPGHWGAGPAAAPLGQGVHGVDQDPPVTRQPIYKP